MTAFDMLPAYLVEELINPPKFGARELREDLKAIRAAEKAGWYVTFKNDSWHNSASFQKGDTHIWYATDRYGRGAWRIAELQDGYFRNHRWHTGPLLEALGIEKEIADA